MGFDGVSPSRGGRIFSGEEDLRGADALAWGESAPMGGGEGVGLVREPELRIDAFGGVGDERPEQHRQDPTTFGEVVEHGIEALGLGGILGEFERGSLIDVLIGAVDDVPGGEEGGLEAVLAEVFDGGLGGGADFGGELIGAGGDDAVAVALEHRE